MGKFEKKFGKYAIRNLSLILVACYGVGYLLMMTPLSYVLNYLTLNPYRIIHGEVWRLVTWIIVPPSGFGLTTLITLFFYWSIGRSLESAWGDWMYNIYIFSGMFFTVLGSFAIMLYYYLFPIRDDLGNALPLFLLMETAQFAFTTYYVNMSIFLAFAATFPNATVLLMFIIPIRVKWLGIIYGAFLVYEFVSAVLNGGVITAVVILVSLLNFLIFFFLKLSRSGRSPRARMRQAVRRHEYNASIKNAEPKIARHKCAICGRTDEEYPDLEFRYCSKCKGNFEYCSEHLFTHKHVE
ncbi:MAG: hypothetical protein K5796_09270 [Lachnospiraceae bacterium]|nr:hypothetical protein [Lachnospiraceae bacterium]